MTHPGLDPSQAQRRAASPVTSAWVTASAGTGKTTVLIKRVLALLLTGTPPQRILCLTFTKAAAAEMANRLAETLGEWAVCPDDRLDEALTDLRDSAPDDTIRGRARRLFARVLDVPGGMHIETIHAFCQGVLRRFPLEAGLSPHFRTMEDQDSRELLAEARETVLARCQGPEPRLRDALAAITHLVGQDDFDSLMAQLTTERIRFDRFLVRHGGVEAAIDDLGRALGVAPGDREDRVLTALCEEAAFDGAALRRAIGTLQQGSDAEGDRAGVLAHWLAGDVQTRREGLEDYVAQFLTAREDADGPRLKADRSLATKASRTADPDILTTLKREGERLIAGLERCRAIRVRSATAALLRLADAILGEYRRRKERGALMDFDDLIARTRALLTPDRVPWVLYKLDGGIDHVLIDEAQDSNADQWRVVESLVTEFFAGESAREMPRTLFAVGDVKQSIYSFQGAQPAEFARLQDEFGHRVCTAGGGWQALELVTSFRSTRAVLGAVDLVFNRDPARSGVAEDGPLTHAVHRNETEGGVEVWPLMMPPDNPDPEPWMPPVEALQRDPADTRLARLMARRMVAMIGRNGGPGEQLMTSDGPRRVRPRDIMVLVRRRGRFVEELVRQLKSHDIPVAGADRMVVTDQLAVRDLVALGRFVLLPDDDLNLAALLKGPLIGFDEEQLFDLAHGRRETLWHDLTARRGERADFADAHAQLARWLARADAMPPFEFFSQLLSTDGGRRRIIARLGHETEDPMDEFLSLALAHEQSHPPSMEGFLHWLERGQTEIKRDLEQTPDDVVRIMTVHGSKGLEAPIVFLPDTIGQPQSRKPLLWTGDPDNTDAELLLWAPRVADTAPLGRQARAARQQAQSEEYHRLLYVAMTRARDRLIVCGWGRRGSSGQSNGADWYWLIHDALKEHGRAVEDPILAASGDVADPTILLYGQPALPHAPPTGEDAETGEAGASDTESREADSSRIESQATPSLPAWLHTPAPADPVPPRPLTPSRPDDEPARLSPVAAKGVERYRRGILIHRLLQSLPDLPAAGRREKAERWLAHAASDLDMTTRQSMLDETLAVIDHPDFAVLFGPGSRPEQPLAGVVGDHVVSGQVDRLVILADRVLVVDYKTNRPPPTLAARVSPAYIRQMAAYRAVLQGIHRDRPVSCFLLWTDGPTLMALPDDLLDQVAP